MADRKRARAIGDAEEAREEARLEAMRINASAHAAPNSIVPRRVRPKHTHAVGSAGASSSFAAAAGRSSSLVSAASSTVAVAASRAPPMPPRRLLLSRDSSNVVVSLQARSLGALAPSRLSERIVARRVDSLTLAQQKEIQTTHVQTINDLDVDRTEARYLLSCGGDGLIAVYDVANELNKRGYRAKALHRRKNSHREFAVSCVQWYPFDTGLFISGSMDGQVTVWDTNTFTVAHAFKLNGITHAARMSPVATTHSLIATGTAHPNVRLCDMNSGAFSHTLIGHSSDVLCLDWSPTNEFHLITGSADRTLRVWDIRRAGAMMILDEYNQSTPFINVKYVDAEEMRAKRDVCAHDGAVTGVEWCNDGMTIVSSGADKKIRRWDARSGKNTLINYPGVTVSARINRFAVSCNGASLYFPNGLSVSEYDLASGRVKQQLRGHFERVVCCATNAATQDVYSAGVDRQILVWTAADDERAADDDTEEERATAAAERERLRAAQEAADQEAQMRIMQPSRPAAAAPLGPRPDEDAWSDED